MEVEYILQKRGMASPQPSRREALFPQDITATLCKIHQVPDISSVTSEDEIKPIKVAPIWHGMALDLMLGNLDQKLWGWSDPQSINFLDYWYQLDDRLTFVLVYDEPKQAIFNATLNRNTLSSTTIENHINNWKAYNGALLAFFLRNRSRCVLVNAQQVKRNADACLQQLQHLLSTQLLSTSGNDIEKICDVIADSEASNSALSNNPNLSVQKLTEITKLAGLDAKETQKVLQGNEVDNYLLEQLLVDYPACQHLYAELQSVASLPMQDEFKEELNPGAVLEKMVQQRLMHAELALSLHQAYLGMSELFEISVTKQLQEENKQLLTQVHQVQDELERFFVENQKLKKQQAPVFYGAAERIKQELGYRLGATMIKRSRSLTGWLGMSQALAAERKAWHQQDTTKPENNLPPISVYRDAHEAERVKNHLSYRLGHDLISSEGSLFRWIKLPFALHRSVRQYRHQRKDN
jgi:DNA polymerase III delta prime subunit